MFIVSPNPADMGGLGAYGFLGAFCKVALVPAGRNCVIDSGLKLGLKIAFGASRRNVKAPWRVLR